MNQECFKNAKLKGRIAEKGYNISKLAPRLNLSARALGFKISGKVEFRQGEIFKLVDLLDIPSDEVYDYFFET